MKLVIAYIQPQQLPAVKQALYKAGVPHMTCTNVLGTTPEAPEHQAFRGVAQDVELFQKVRLELAIQNDELETVTAAIVAGGRESGGHGKIFVVELKDCIEVKTGKTGADAI